MARNFRNIIRNVRAVFSSNGYYYKRIASNSSIWIWSLILSAICTFITYPGIWYSDSYSRVDSTKMVLECARMILKGKRSEIVAQSWITITPSFFMAISEVITGHVGLYTLAQTFSFFAVTFLLIKRMCSSYRKIQYILFALSPMIYGVSVYYEAGIGCVTGMVAWILLAERIRDEKSLPDRVMEFILLMFSSFVVFGYRANAFTIIPVLVIYIGISKIKKIQKLCALVAMTSGLILVLTLPWLLKIDTMSSSSASFVWEILTVIQRMDQEDREKYDNYLDEIGGEGSTKIALETSNENSINGFCWGEGLNATAISEEGSSGIILHKYIKLIVSEPFRYLKMKWDFTKRTLGIGNRIICAEYDYDRWGGMSQYGFNDSIQRQQFVDSYILTNNILGFYTCQPWLVFLISFVLVLIEFLRKNKKRDLFVFVLFIAVFYYGAYIINTQSFELRYFYPSLYFMMILDVAIELEWIKNGMKFIKSRGKRG